MINKYIRYIRKHWKLVIAIIFIIIISLCIIQALNEAAKIQNREQQNKINEDKSEIYKTESVLGEGTISDSEAIQNNTIIDNFITYCNEGKTKQAYSLISEECKQEVFPTIEEFINNYYKIIFSQYKKYNLQNWISNDNKTTYKVRFENDALAIGGYDEKQTFEDYITVVKKKDVYYLNINKFIGRNEINKKASYEGINVKINSESIYLNNRIYDITFENNTSNDIELYNISNGTQWYLQDEKEKKYLASLSEITNSNLILKENSKMPLKVTFMKIYNKNDTLQNITFEKIQVLNTTNKFNIQVKI